MNQGVWGCSTPLGIQVFNFKGELFFDVHVPVNLFAENYR